MSAPFRVPYMSRPSYRVQLVSSGLEGVFFGALLNIAFVAGRDLGAPRWAIVGYMAITAIPMMLTPVLAGRLAGARRKPLFWTAALVGRATFVGVVFWSSWAPVLLTGLLPWFVMPIVLPAYNVYWQANYPAHLRGRILARADFLRGAFAAASAFAFGYLLRRDPELRRLLIPIGGLCGCGALALIGHIRLRRRVSETPAGTHGAWTGWRWVLRPWRTAIELLRNHRSFLWYEAGFMLYGFGFMFCNFLRDDHFQRDLRLSHAQFGVFLAISQIAMPLSAPLFGAIFDRFRAAWTTAVGCAFLAPYALTLALAQNEWHLYGAAVLFGMGMSGIHMCWQLGSVEFAGREDAGPFTAVHAGFVGVRAMLVLPIVLYSQFYFRGDARPVFLAAAGLFGCAILLQLWVGRRQRHEDAFAPILTPTSDSGRLAAAGPAGS